jgi:hypothetical protein
MSVVFIQLHNAFGDEMWVAADKILHFARKRSGSLTWIAQMFTDEFEVTETPGQIVELLNFGPKRRETEK